MNCFILPGKMACYLVKFMEKFYSITISLIFTPIFRWPHLRRPLLRQDKILTYLHLGPLLRPHQRKITKIIMHEFKSSRTINSIWIFLVAATSLIESSSTCSIADCSSSSFSSSPPPRKCYLPPHFLRPRRSESLVQMCLPAETVACL